MSSDDAAGFLYTHSTGRHRARDGNLRFVFTVVDLFSGAGGMSYGFHAHPAFRVIGAVDAQRGKPTSTTGIECNGTYEANMGVRPLERDLAKISGEELRAELGRPTVLISCAPCTGFSRTLSSNHLVDDRRNSLVSRSAEFVAALRPEIFLMENARELIRGNFAHHYEALRTALEALGYTVSGAVHRLDRFGLPQIRERALVIAARGNVKTLDDLWSGIRLAKDAVTVRRAFADVPDDEAHVAPGFSDPITRKRIALIPHDGGSWADLRNVRGGLKVMTPAMRRYLAAGDLGSHPDVYGRLAWDKPAVTIKRECAHVGNGRYVHPEEDRLCTVRELAILQGFPRDYRFVARSLSNMYRHVGDAVPPLISYQLAGLCAWMLGRERPSVRDMVLPNTSLRVRDLTPFASSSRRRSPRPTSSAPA
jgi:DNA (cytosine-5)-methyltransferase 1